MRDFHVFSLTFRCSNISKTFALKNNELNDDERAHM